MGAANKRFKNSMFAHEEKIPCFWCGTPLTEQLATVDHLIPVSQGGLGLHDNKVIACVSCNHERSVITNVQNKKERGRSITKTERTLADALFEKYLILCERKRVSDACIGADRDWIAIKHNRRSG